ncbi:MAG TPA: hypothetical protein VGQ17_07700, partial [Gemmatimonadales bacterium]|nr:hypothetical protein [Gemmatimonadales bacterium]
MRPRLVLLIALLAFLAPAGLLAQTYGVSVTPQGGTAPNTPIWSTGNSYLFRVQNEGSAQDTWTLTCQGAGSVTVASCPSSITLAGNTFQRVTVTFSTGNEGTGTLYLTASSSNSSDQGWVTVPVVVPAGAPRMAVLPYLDAKQDLGRCAVSCFAATYAQGTVPYFSLETPRNVTLVYHGDRLKPRPFVAVDVWPDTTFGGWPSEYQLQVKMDGSSLVTFL